MSVSPISEPIRAAATESARMSFIDGLLEDASHPSAPASELAARFPQEVSRLLQEWLARAPRARSARHLLTALNCAVASIDRVINDQVNAILHHRSFQRLEASWRGLDFLVRRKEGEGSAAVKIKVMTVSWSELARDFDRAIEFDQSQLFRKIYENEFGSPGGEPFGALIADYEVHPAPVKGATYHDLDVLESIAGVAAAAFCPFFANASPSMFDLGDDFVGLQGTFDHAHVLKQSQKWRSLTEREDARFVGLVMPRVLMRLPYTADSQRVDGFCFVEDVAGPTHGNYLWGGAAFALGAVIMRAFENAEWPADIRGVQRGVDGGGLVTGLLVDEPGTDSRRVAYKFSTDVVITDDLEKQLGDLGFIPLCHCYDTPYAAFYSVPSVQKPRVLDRAPAQANARLSSMMQYILCVSRFAHYIKVMGRDRVGSVTSAEQLERILEDWLKKYVTLDDSASPEVKARYPLREARVQVRPKPGASGAYHSVIHLVPHYQLDEFAVKVRLTTEISPVPGAR
jgi:type VI secretion system ImpC/EvpB family protein